MCANILSSRSLYSTRTPSIQYWIFCYRFCFVLFINSPPKIKKNEHQIYDNTLFSSYDHSFMNIAHLSLYNMLFFFWFIRMNELFQLNHTHKHSWVVNNYNFTSYPKLSNCYCDWLRISNWLWVFFSTEFPCLLVLKVQKCQVEKKYLQRLFRAGDPIAIAKRIKLNRH